MAGYRMFNQVQFGLGDPGAPGTPAARTAIWQGQVKLPMDRKPYFPPMNLVAPVRSNQVNIYQCLTDGIVLAGPENAAYWEMLPAMLSIFLHGGITPAEKTPDQGDYVWPFLMVGVSGATLEDYPFALDSLTLECGDDTGSQYLPFVTGKRLTLSGAYGQDQAVKAELECFANQSFPGAGCAPLPAAVCTPILANLVKMNLNDTWATRSSAAPVTSLHDWSVELLNNAVPKWHGNGVNFDSVHLDYLDWLLTMTLERGDISSNLRDVWDANEDGVTAPVAFNLQLNGPQIGAGTYQNLTMNFWGTPEQYLPMDSEDGGRNLDKFVFHPMLDVAVQGGALGSFECELVSTLDTVAGGAPA